VRLEPLYRVEFSYPSPEVRGLYFAEGACSGALAGRFRGMNHPRVRPEDDAYLPNIQGMIETEDGARIAFDYRGFGRARDYRREVVGAAFHSTGDQRYARLNDAVCVLAGEARERVIRLEVSEVLFEPLPGGSTSSG
jgi:hypothetical protein